MKHNIFIKTAIGIVFAMMFTRTGYSTEVANTISENQNKSVSNGEEVTVNVDEMEKSSSDMTDEELLDKTNELTQTNEKISDVDNEMEKIDPTTYIPVLMYHHFIEGEMEEPNGSIMTIDSFEDHLRTFQELGYKPIFYDELYDMILNEDNKEGFDDKYICITMDDGYRSNFELAYPLLKKYDMKSSISVITSRIHVDYISAQEIPKLSWSDLNEMQESGNVKIYNHSTNHVQETQITTDEFKKAVTRAEDLLNKELDFRGLKVFTYPYGDHNFLTTTTLREMGYDLQILTDFGVVDYDTSIKMIPRINIDSGMTGQQVIDKIESAAEKTLRPKMIANQEEKERKEIELKKLEELNYTQTKETENNTESETVDNNTMIEG